MKRARRAVTAALGAQLRAADPNVAAGAALVTLIEGKPVERATLEAAIGRELVDDLVATGVMRAKGEAVSLDHALALAHDVIFAAPDPDPDDAARFDILYLDRDSALLTEAALRLAPSGLRAVDLGAGTGLHAAVLARHYETVIATDLGPRVAAAARLTLDLNGGDGTGVLVADVGAGLRPRSFDLVTANPPWVPRPDDAAGAKRRFADGGPTGTELPCRFIREGAELLRPGGVAVVLALDVQCDDGSRPIREVCDELAAGGFVTAVVPTRFSGLTPDLEPNMRDRQPRLLAVEHVAVVVASVSERGDFERKMREVIGQLTKRWAEVDEAPTRE